MRIEEVIGHNLRARREELGLTQEEVAQKAGQLLDANWARQTVYMAEKGSRAFTAAELLVLAFVLSTSVEWLFRPPLATDRVTLPSGKFLARQDITYGRVVEGGPEQLLDELREVLQQLGPYGALGSETVAQLSAQLNDLYRQEVEHGKRTAHLLERANGKIDTLAKALATRDDSLQDGQQ